MGRGDLAYSLAVTGSKDIGDPVRRALASPHGYEAAGHGPNHLMTERLACKYHDDEISPLPPHGQMIDPAYERCLPPPAAKRREVVLAEQVLAAGFHRLHIEPWRAEVPGIVAPQRVHRRSVADLVPVPPLSG